MLLRVQACRSTFCAVARFSKGARNGEDRPWRAILGIQEDRSAVFRLAVMAGAMIGYREVKGLDRLRKTHLIVSIREPVLSAGEHVAGHIEIPESEIETNSCRQDEVDSSEDVAAVTIISIVVGRIVQADTQRRGKGNRIQSVGQSQMRFPIILLKIANGRVDVFGAGKRVIKSAQIVTNRP